MAIQVTLDGIPEDAPVQVILSAKPKTTAEFDAIVAAGGGPEKFRVGYGGTYISANLDGGVHLQVEPPADYVTPRPPEGHPFILEFGKTIEAAKGGES